MRAKQEPKTFPCIRMELKLAKYDASNMGVNSFPCIRMELKLKTKNTNCSDIILSLASEWNWNLKTVTESLNYSSFPCIRMELKQVSLRAIRDTALILSLASEWNWNFFSYFEYLANSSFPCIRMELKQNWQNRCERKGLPFPCIRMELKLESCNVFAPCRRNFPLHQNGIET